MELTHSTGPYICVMAPDHPPAPRRQGQNCCSDQNHITLTCRFTGARVRDQVRVRACPAKRVASALTLCPRMVSVFPYLRARSPLPTRRSSDTGHPAIPPRSSFTAHHCRLHARPHRNPRAFMRHACRRSDPSPAALSILRLLQRGHGRQPNSFHKSHPTAARAQTLGQYAHEMALSRKLA
jgi:hypothetical protein